MQVSNRDSHKGVAKETLEISGSHMNMTMVRINSQDRKVDSMAERRIHGSMSGQECCVL